MIPGVGTFQGSIVLTPNAPDLSPITIPVTLFVPATAPPEPVITSVVNGASFQPGVVANSWATIQGSNLASTTDNWNSSIKNGELPDSLDGVTVQFDGMPAAVDYISPTQINVLVPNVTSSSTRVVVTNAGSIGAGVSAPANQFGPAFFSWPENQVVATRTGLQLCGKERDIPQLDHRGGEAWRRDHPVGLRLWSHDAQRADEAWRRRAILLTRPARRPR